MLALYSAPLHSYFHAFILCRKLDIGAYWCLNWCLFSTPPSFFGGLQDPALISVDFEMTLVSLVGLGPS